MGRTWLAVTTAVVLGSAVLVGSPADGSLPASASVAQAMDDFEDYDWWYEAMAIEQAHGTGATGRGVKVALIDSPLELQAAELQGQDIILRTSCRGGRADPIPPQLYEQDDEADHGTSMASLIAGSGRGNAPGGVGIAGVAPEAQLLAYDIQAGSPDLCRGYQIGDLVDQAVEDGADVISMSLTIDQGVEPAVRRALEAGVVVVGGLSSVDGNDDVMTYPAVTPGVVAVQAVDRNADAWARTKPSDHAVIAAPGVDVGHGLWNPETDRFDSRGYGTGTSQATAIVSGALAAVKSKYPDATGDQLVQHLIHNPGGEENFDWDATYGFGIVSVTTMLRSSPMQWPDENPLLEGPTAAVEDYPAWVSSEVADPPDKGADAPEQESSTGSDRANDEQQQTGSDGADAADEQDQGAGAPGWLWAVAGLLAIAIAGAVTMATRRRGASAA